MSFEGFPRQLIEFLCGLRANNNRAWFEAHRKEYETQLLDPARAFVATMGECLRGLGSDIHAEPRVRGSIFAINRDIRFSRLGAGMHGFSDATLERYRTAVLDHVQGEKLEAVGQQLNDRGIEIGGQTYKKVPNNLPANHPRAEWLRHSGLFAATEQPLPDELFSEELAGVCATQFQRVAPLQQWLVDLLAG